MFSGITANNGAQIFKDFAAAIPDAKLYGPDGVAESAFTDPKEGGIPASVGREDQGDGRHPGPGEYPPEGQEFFKQFEREVRRQDARPVRDLRLRGHEPRARRDRAGRLGRQGGHPEALFDTKDRSSVLGTYSIDENGDTTLTDYGVYKIEGGELTFDKTVKAQT